MKGVVIGSETEAAIKRQGLYVPDQLIDILRDKTSAMIVELENIALANERNIAMIHAVFDRGRTSKNYYDAVFRLPYERDSIKIEEAYKTFGARFERGKAAGIIPPSVTWAPHESMEIRMKSVVFDDLLKGVFDGTINPMLEEVNQKKGTNYSMVDYKAIIEADERAAAEQAALGPYTAAQLKRGSPKSGDLTPGG